ncbi:UNKNOWN [Stylonychia lemnae]|uniref:Uncharacterized protein n=1 Tax=Stylonychia lemnae TaxID=5949 RepID=A0A078ARU8_STYLE|nr:UNKNOWN [Stylonychia lemnae]|eukprot:CDW84711.1 UNKNOWN [Stylonychia lemnae]
MDETISQQSSQIKLSQSAFKLVSNIVSKSEDILQEEIEDYLKLKGRLVFSDGEDNQLINKVSSDQFLGIIVFNQPDLTKQSSNYEQEQLLEDDATNVQIGSENNQDQETAQLQQQQVIDRTSSSANMMDLFNNLEDQYPQFDVFDMNFNDPKPLHYKQDWICSLPQNNHDSLNHLIQTFNQDQTNYQELLAAEQPNPTEDDFNDPDDTIIFTQIQKSLSKKSSAKSLDRPDVISKTIFRICRSFYTSKLDCQKKQDQQDQNQTLNLTLLETLDSLSDKLLKGFDYAVNQCQESFANYLLALIFPKCIQMIDREDSMNDDDDDNEDSSNSSNLSSKEKPWVVFGPKQKKRIKIIQEISNQTQSVLYTFNKKNLRAFLEINENVLILRHFLTKTIRVFENYFQIYDRISKIKVCQRKKYKTKKNKKGISSYQRRLRVNYMQKPIDERTLLLFNQAIHQLYEKTIK